MANLKDTIVLGKLSVLGGIHSSQTISGNNIELTGDITFSNNHGLSGPQGVIGFNDEGRPTIISPDRSLAVGTNALDGNYCYYTFPATDGTVALIDGSGTLTATTICTNSIKGKNNIYCQLTPTAEGWKLYDSDTYGNIIPGSDGTGTLGKTNRLFNKVFTEYLEVLNINKYLAIYSKSLSATTTNQTLWSIPNGTCGKLIISSNTEYAIYNVWKGTSSSKFTVEYSSFKSTYITPTMSDTGFISVRMSNSNGNQTIYAILLAVHNGLVTKANAGIITA